MRSEIRTQVLDRSMSLPASLLPPSPTACLHRLTALLSRILGINPFTSLRIMPLAIMHG